MFIQILTLKLYEINRYASKLTLTSIVIKRKKKISGCQLPILVGRGEEEAGFACSSIRMIQRIPREM